MAVSIRLARIGKKKAPFYRIVAIDSRKSRDGQYIENLGTYNPLTGELVQFHQERIQSWISNGAIPSETVVKLQKQYARSLKNSADKIESSVKKTIKTVTALKKDAANKQDVFSQEVVK